MRYKKSSLPIRLHLLFLHCHRLLISAVSRSSLQSSTSATPFLLVLLSCRFWLVLFYHLLFLTSRSSVFFLRYRRFEQIRAVFLYDAVHDILLRSVFYLAVALIGDFVRIVFIEFNSHLKNSFSFTFMG